MGGLYGRLGMAPWEGVLGLWNICSGTIGIHLAPVPSCVVLDTPQVMTSLASLLASWPDVPLEGVRGLVDQGLPEGLILDYKEAYHPHIVETVVAMANTYGGLILVGVTDSPPRQLLGVEETVATSIANVCHDSLEPPWVPEIIPLPIDEKRDMPHRRAHGAQSAHLDPSSTKGGPWCGYMTVWRLPIEVVWLSCSKEAAASVPAIGLGITPPQIDRDADGNPNADFVIRSGVHVPLGERASWRPFSDRAIERLASALFESSKSRF